MSKITPQTADLGPVLVDTCFLPFFFLFFCNGFIELQQAQNCRALGFGLWSGSGFPKYRSEPVRLLKFAINPCVLAEQQVNKEYSLKQRLFGRAKKAHRFLSLIGFNGLWAMYWGPSHEPGPLSSDQSPYQLQCFKFLISKSDLIFHQLERTTYLKFPQLSRRWGLNPDLSGCHRTLNRCARANRMSNFPHHDGIINWRFFFNDLPSSTSTEMSSLRG